MRYEFDYEYSDELLRSAMKRSLIHRGWRAPVTLAIALVAVMVLCAGDDWGYLCGAAQGALVMLVLLFVLSHVSAAQESEQFARKLPTRAARCVFTDEAMTIENAFATSVLKWPVVQKVVRGPDVWLFFLARGQFMALPAGNIDAQIGAFIESRVTAAGGKMQ
jgi:hypothetical protein